MNLILTAAGTYQRFRRFSYEVPKYLLPVRHNNMLSCILNGFNLTNLSELENVLFIGNKRDVKFAGVIENTIKSKAKMYKILWIDDTSGQAQTMLHALSYLSKNVYVHNVDTALHNRKIIYPYDAPDCVIDIFESSNSAYSYVIENDNKAVEIREKSVISNKASSGCFFFKDLEKLVEHIDDSTNYISEVVNRMIHSGMDVQTTRLHKPSETIVMGTPEEYLTNLNYEIPRFL